MVCCYLPVHDVLRENMGAEWVWVPLPESRDNMVPCTPDVGAATEILDHFSLDDVQDGVNPKP